MTLGKKLSNYRKTADLTQQQLADMLNLSAQAISKWENDMSEPDLTTLKTLARLYNTTVDEILDVESISANAIQPIDAEAVADTASAKTEEHAKSESVPIGFCKSCGIMVTEDNLAETEPVIMCKKCKEKQIAREEAEAVRLRELEERREKEAEERKIREEKETEERKIREEKETEERKIREEKEAEERKERIIALEQRDKKAQINGFLWKRNRALFWGGIISVPFLFLMFRAIFIDITSSESWSTALLWLVVAYTVFAFVFTLFHDTFINDLLLDMLTKTVNWPFLIFSFSLDGIIWLIGMKILFAVLGFLIGILWAILGIVMSVFLSFFACPIILLSYSVKILKIKRRKGIYDKKKPLRKDSEGEQN